MFKRDKREEEKNGNTNVPKRENFLSITFRFFFTSLWLVDKIQCAYASWKSCTLNTSSCTYTGQLRSLAKGFMDTLWTQKITCHYRYRSTSLSLLVLHRILNTTPFFVNSLEVIKFHSNYFCRWNAPISIALHAPGTDFLPTIKAIKYLRDCTPEGALVRQFTTFHIYFSSKHVPKIVSVDASAHLLISPKRVDGSMTANCALTHTHYGIN